MLWFCSDFHFFHKNIIRFCNRDFSSVEEMNAEMIKRWNEVVSEGDTVYVVGDFAFCNNEMMSDILKQLKGDKILIKGNHDRGKPTMIQNGFKEAYDVLFLDIAGENVMLCHYPYRPKEVDPDHPNRYRGNPVDKGKWLIHGHVHQHWFLKEKMINVSVDVIDFRPISIKEIEDIITGKRIR